MFRSLAIIVFMLTSAAGAEPADTGAPTVSDITQMCKARHKAGFKKIGVDVESGRSEDADAKAIYDNLILCCDEVFSELETDTAAIREYFLLHHKLFYLRSTDTQGAVYDETYERRKALLDGMSSAEQNRVDAIFAKEYACNRRLSDTPGGQPKQ